MMTQHLTPRQHLELRKAKLFQPQDQSPRSIQIAHFRRCVFERLGNVVSLAQVETINQSILKKINAKSHVQSNGRRLVFKFSICYADLRLVFDCETKTVVTIL